MEQAEHFLRQHPNDPKALNDLGIMRAANGDLDDGAKLLDRAHQAAPDDPVIAYNDARLKYQQGKTQESIRMIEDALRDHPDMGEARTALAAMQVEQKEYDQAGETIKKLPQDQAKTIHALLVIGGIQLLTGHVDEAIQSFQEAIKVDPDNAAAQFDLGCAYLAKNLLDPAKQNFLGALSKNPQLAEAHNNLGALYIRAGNTTAAIAEFQRASQENPNNAIFAKNLSNSQHNASTNIFQALIPSVVPKTQGQGESALPSSSSDSEEAQAARNAVNRIRSGPHEAMPQAEAAHTGRGDATSMTVQNNTGYGIHVYLAGPVSHTLQIPAGGSRTVGLVPGHYSVAADIPGNTIRPFYGVQDYQSGVQYSEAFYIQRLR
jgi:tetratricopeptide (TPR) repeat protein